jgi:threonine dehydrogenase-like Zn-dependent dehydrogenase
VRAISRWSADRKCDVVVECVGRGTTQTLALELAGSRATVALAGLGTDTVQLDLCATLIERHGLRLLGVAATPVRHFSGLVEIAGRHAGAFEGLVTHRFALEQADEAFAVMENGSCGKVVFDISNEFRG